MRSAWSAKVAEKKHRYAITNVEIAERYGCCKQYIGQILNGTRSPVGARERIENIVKELIEEKKN